jgi:hypothetical protein
MRIAGIVAVGLIMSSPGMADAWRARNYHEVNAVSDSVFEVIGRPGSGPAQFWCGAGDFARVVLNVKPTQRIYVWRGRGGSATRPGKTSVQFAFSPAPGSEDFRPGLTLNIKQAGDYLNAAAARQYCDDYLPGEVWPPWP